MKNIYFSGFGGKIQWTSLNPHDLLKNMKSLNYQFPFDTLEQYMKRAAISTGYTEKPCLDPKDPLCPETAPNKKSQMVCLNKRSSSKYIFDNFFLYL